MERPDICGRACRPSSTRMPFIISRDLEKADPATRKLIRSHVMQGKKKRSLPRKNMQVAEVHNPVRRALRTVEFQARLAEEMRHRYTTSVPRRVGSDLSFIEFAEDIELSMLLNITKVGNVALSIIFPLMDVVGFRVDQEKRLYPMQGDAAALHVSAFAIEDFIHRVLRCQEGTSYIAMLHYQKGLGILRERLLSDDNKAKMTDSTLGTILKLASAAHFNGDPEASDHHMRGVRRMVDLRGGLRVFDGREIQLEMFRYDLSIALVNDSPPFFCNSEDAFIDYPEELLTSSDDHMGSQEIMSFLHTLEPGLATAWRALKRFCLLANLGVQTRRRMRPQMIQEAMASVMYRLLHMRFASGSIDEPIRYGLLAFSHHLFLQWHDIRPPASSSFSNKYRSHLVELNRTDGLPSHLILWLLMIGAISIFDVSVETWLEDGLRKHIEKSGLRKWKDVQDLMKSLMWVAALDEQEGKRSFNSVRPTKSKHNLGK